MLNRYRRPARATAVLSSVLAAALLASCTSAVGERRDAADGEPVDGGTVRIGALTDLRPKTLYAAATTAEQSVSGLVFDTLTSYETEDSTAALTRSPRSPNPGTSAATDSPSPSTCGPASSSMTAPLSPRMT